jgi:hypothetical protein
MDFCSGLGPFCKYFSKVEGPVVSFPNAQGLWCNLQQSQMLRVKLRGFIEFGSYFSMLKSVDRVHGTLDRWRGRGHGGPAGGTDNGRGGASLAHHPWALEISGGG